MTRSIRRHPLFLRRGSAASSAEQRQGRSRLCYGSILRAAVVSIAAVSANGTAHAQDDLFHFGIIPNVMDFNYQPVSVPNAEYVFTVECTGAGGNPAVPSVTFTSNSAGEFSPPMGVIDIAVPNECAMTRTTPSDPPPGYRWEVRSPYNFFPTDPGDFEMFYMIGLMSGSLKITKTVSMPLPQDATFDFTVDCTHANAVVTPLAAADATQHIAIAAGATTGSATIAHVADGSTCTVTETPPAPIAGYAWGATPDPDTGIAITVSTQSAVEFTNILTPTDPDLIFADGFDAG